MAGINQLVRVQWALVTVVDETEDVEERPMSRSSSGRQGCSDQHEYCSSLNSPSLLNIHIQGS